MTQLIKDFTVDVTAAGVPGTAGSPGVAARAGYWSDRSPVTAIEQITPTDSLVTWVAPATPPLGQYIRRATQAETRYASTVRPFYDNYAAAILSGVNLASRRTALKDEWHRALTAIQNNGLLGRPLAFLPTPYLSGTFIGAWNTTQGTWFYLFYGFTSYPSQVIVN